MTKKRVKRTLGEFVLLVVLLFVLPTAAQIPEEWTSEDIFTGCTSIMVGRKASTDGSIITCHSCDGNYRTWLEIVPHATHEVGETREIYWGNLHTETPWDQRRRYLKGEIPQVEETYAFMNVAYPCMNEKQLAIGETTIRGRADLRNDDGLFLIENLQAIALERCTTAREAIQLIGKLVKEYGYGDSGECLTFADPKEVWHFEIFGGGPFEVGAVWAAVRIPDDHIGVSANIPRISELDLEDPDNYMASENVYDLAIEMEWWDPNSGEPFKFWEAYSGRKPFSDREYYIFNTLAPSLNLQFDAEELPFSIKPDNKISVRDVMRYYRETYEDTDFDMTKNLLIPRPRRRGEPLLAEGEEPEKMKSSIANPWMSRDMINLLNELKPETIERRRTIAIAGCSYSQIIQCRDWLPDEIGGIAWFSFDNPGQSPRIPIFAGVLNLPESFAICGQKRYRIDAAIWSFRRANRLATVNWGRARTDLEEAVMAFEDKAFAELPAIEEKALELYKQDQKRKKEVVENDNNNETPPQFQKFLTKYTNDFARAAMNTWWELGDRFWGFFGRGF